MVDVIGWIGSIFFAVCGAPQAWKCYQEGHARGMSPFFVCFWLGGELCYVVTILLKFGWVGWMMFNYGMNLIFITVIIFYLVRPRKSLIHCQKSTMIVDERKTDGGAGLGSTDKKQPMASGQVPRKAV